jgi:hypothetical protein
MGCGPFSGRRLSGSPYDSCRRPEPPADNRNPNPLVYHIDEWKQVGRYLIVVITYPNCTNYEGKKILVYEGITIDYLKRQVAIDPHFSNNKDYVSPVARFEPTEHGAHIAAVMVKELARRDEKGIK